MKENRPCESKIAYIPCLQLWDVVLREVAHRICNRPDSSDLTKLRDYSRFDRLDEGSLTLNAPEVTKGNSMTGSRWSLLTAPSKFYREKCAASAFLHRSFKFCSPIQFSVPLCQLTIFCCSNCLEK